MASTYSTGMKKRLAIGLAIMTNPKLLILDEPTKGLDFNSVLKLRRLLRSLKEEFQMSIIFSSHNLSEIEKISDRIIFIKEGEIVNVEDDVSDFYYEIEVDTSISDIIKKVELNFRIKDDKTFIINNIKDLNSFLKMVLNSFLKMVYDNSYKLIKIEKNTIP